MTLILSPKTKERLVKRYIPQVKTKIANGELYICEDQTRVINNGNGFCQLQPRLLMVSRLEDGEHIFNIRYQLVSREWESRMKEFKAIMDEQQNKKLKKLEEASQEFKELFLDMQKTRFSWLKKD